MNTVISGLLIPFAGTAAGAACVFFLKKDLKRCVQRALSGFAAGVMVAASIWSLIVPAIEQSEDMGKFAFLPAFIGFWLGVGFLLLLDHVIPHLHRSIDQTEGPESRLPRTAMMVLAVTLHNIPEGMAVGVVYAGLLSGSASITAGAALALALGIAIQNFPEKQAEVVLARRTVRRGRTGVRRADGPYREPCRARHAISVVLCRRRDAVCGRGGTDPGDVGRRTFKYWRSILCRRLQSDDGARRGAGIT